MKDVPRAKERDRMEDKLQSRIPNSMERQGVRIIHPFNDLQLCKQEAQPLVQPLFIDPIHYLFEEKIHSWI